MKERKYSLWERVQCVGFGLCVILPMVVIHYISYAVEIVLDEKIGCKVGQDLAWCFAIIPWTWFRLVELLNPLFGRRNKKR